MYCAQGVLYSIYISSAKFLICHHVSVRLHIPLAKSDPVGLSFDNFEPRSSFPLKGTEAVCMLPPSPHSPSSACRQVAGVHVQRSARHHTVSFSLLTSEGGKKEEGRKGQQIGGICSLSREKSLQPANIDICDVAYRARKKSFYVVGGMLQGS